MMLLASLALFGWIPFVVVLFAIIPARQAAAVAVIGAWLLLPPISMEIVGLPDFSKQTCPAIGIVLGTIAFGSSFLVQLRFRWCDLPVLLWCLSAIGTSLYNGLGLYDGLANMVGLAIQWGLPYLAGRLYFGNPEGLRVFTVAMVIGGLMYALPCLWENRMSPQLMAQIYGLSGYGDGPPRLGGYRPRVFFQTGLECGMWMNAAAFVGWWLYRSGAVKRIGGISYGRVLVSILIGTAILCRSTGAALLLVGGIFLLWASTRFRTKILLWGLAFFLPLYAGLRVPNLWSGDELVSFFGTALERNRGDSLGFRFMCENRLIERALEHPVWGWGGYGRNRAYHDDAKTNLVAMDGLWIITLGTRGFVGLSLFYLVLELPVILFLVRFPVRLWSHPQVAPAAVAAALLGLYMIDCTLNAFINIIYIAMAGGLAGVASSGVRLTTPATRGEHPNEGLSSPAVSRIAMADRLREQGRSLKLQGLWVDAYSAWQQAFEMLTELVAHYPDSPALLERWCDCGNDLAWLLLNHPELDSGGRAYALSLAVQVMNKCPESDVYRNTLGAAYLRNDDPASAIAILEEATASSETENPFNHVFLAMAYAKLGDRESARRWLSQAAFIKERGYQNHDELVGFCDEAYRAIGDTPTPNLPMIR